MRALTGLKRRLLLRGAIASGLSMAWACAASGLRAGLNVIYLPKQINNPYNTIVGSGVLEAMRELSGSGKMMGPSTAQALAQEPFIQQIIAGRPHAAIIAANDPIALLPWIRKLLATGTKVVAVDTDLATDARDLFINQASQEGVGRAQMQLMAKLMGGKGEFAILSATPTANNQNAWIYWMLQELRRPAYQEMRLVKVAYGNDDPAMSLEQLSGLLQTFPNLRGVIAPTTVGILAAAEHLAGLPRKGTIQLTGLGTPNQMRRYVKDGTVQAFQLWNPVDLGYIAADAAANLAAGVISGKKGDVFSAGRLGTYTVGAKGELILGAPTTFDINNIDQFNY